MAESLEQAFTPHRIKEGERFDTVAVAAYGDPTYVHTLIMDNPHLQAKALLPPGEIMWVRIKTDPETGALLPPWFTDEEDTKPGGGDNGTATPPVTEGPIVALGFAAGYPKVEGKKILFAINKSGRFVYEVRKVGGAVIFQSSGYDFSPGFAIATPDIADAGMYTVRVGSLLSEPIAVGDINAIKFILLPEVSKASVFFQLKYSIDKSGEYPTKLVDLATGTTVYTATLSYTSGTVVTIPISAAGAYELRVGTTLTANVNASEGGSETAPDWLNVAGYRYDVNTHDFTLDLGADSDIEVSILASTGANPSGITQEGTPWNSTTYNQGRNNFVVPPTTEWFLFRPATAGSGGVSPGVTYKILIRRTSTPGEVFTLFFTAPTASTPPGVTVPIDLEGSTSNNCAMGPVITSIVEADQDSVEWTQDASGVKTVKWRVKDATSSAVVASGTVTIINANGQAVFNPSNQPKVAFNTIPDGDYIFEIEGGNCNSNVDSETFTVDTGGTVPGDSCPRRPTIVGSLKTALKNKITWEFDGDGIFSLKWWVDDNNGSRVRSGVVNILAGGVSTGSAQFSPSNRPFVTFADLPDGQYKFGIQGNNCTSIPSEVNFTLNSDTTTLPSSTRAGQLIAVANGKEFSWIEDETIRGSVTPNGLFKLNSPRTRRSWNNQNTCNLWMLNEFYVRYSEDFVNAILGNGVDLDEGEYMFTHYYINPAIANDYNQLLTGSGLWLSFGNPATFESNSGQIGHVYLSVRNV